MSQFHNRLNHFRYLWSFGRIVCILFVLVSLLGVGFLLHGLADYQWAFSQNVRWWVNSFIIGGLIIFGIIVLFGIVKTSRQVVAHLADSLLTDPRQRVAGASSLESLKPETPMQEFHLKRALNEAAGELEKLPFFRKIPVKAIACAFCFFILVVAGGFTLKMLAPEAFRITSIRVMNPESDMAPYSPLVFAVTPNKLNAVYGGEAVAQVEITGGEITEDVVCLVRDLETKRVDQTTVYQESPGHYATKFSNTLSSVEFAFAIGTARSDWHKLDVLLQPKILAVQVKVTPPAYTDKVEEIFSLESSELKVLEGSQVTLTLRSNRPLSGGDLKISSKNSSKRNTPKRVQGDVVNRANGHEVQFSWQAHASSEVVAMIRDIRATPAETPLNIQVKVIPDQIPVIDLETPQQMVLATPETSLPFRAKVEDDHGLSKVSIVRSLVGYSDRSRVLADSLAKREFDFQETLNFSELGVEVGQVLEFYLKAMDRNPLLLGQGVSEVVRVKIISVAEYAERIRSKFELRKFTTRYRVLANAMKQARDSLDKLNAAAKSGDKKAFEQAQKDAQKSHEQAKSLSEKLAQDFKAFSMEERLAQAAKEAAAKLSQNKNEIGAMKFELGSDAAGRAIAKMKERLGGVQKKADQVATDAKTVKKVGDVMQMAARFRKIYNTQKSLVERINVIAKEVARGNTTNTPQLANLGRQQDLNRLALIALAKELKRRSDNLPEGFEQMQADAESFLQKLEELDIQDPMNAAGRSAKEGRSVDASANAILALSLMEQLINKPNNGFCQMCKDGGGLPRFQIKPDMQKTMQQMMDALMGRVPRGNGDGGVGGSGSGAGGSGSDGYSVYGESANIPMYGPDRLQFSASSGMAEGMGSSSKTTAQVPDEQVDNQLKPKNFRKANQLKLLPENIPAKYRNAVKRYFSSDLEEAKEKSN